MSPKTTHLRAVRLGYFAHFLLFSLTEHFARCGDELQNALVRDARNDCDGA